MTGQAGGEVAVKHATDIIAEAIKSIQDFNMDDDYDAYAALDRVHKILLQEYPKSDLVRLARPPAPNGNGTTVGVQPVARLFPHSEAGRDGDGIGTQHYG